MKNIITILFCTFLLSCSSKSFKPGYSMSRVKAYKQIAFIEPLVVLSSRGISASTDSIIHNFDDDIRTTYIKQTTLSLDPTESKYTSIDSLKIPKDSLLALLNRALKDSLTDTTILSSIKAKVSPASKIYLACLKGWFEDRERERAHDLITGAVAIATLGSTLVTFPIGNAFLYSAMIDLNNFKIIYTEHILIPKDLRDREIVRELANKSINKIYYEPPENYEY
jgi:hypothetical protein